MNQTAPQTLSIDREYRCRSESPLAIFLAGGLFGGMFSAAGLVWLYLALYNSEPFELEGLRLVGPAAILAKLVISVLFLSLTAAWVAGLRKVYRAPKHRIALTPEGILLPRDECSTNEESVRYQDILEIRFPQHFVGHEQPSAEMKTRSGVYSIKKGWLKGRDFEELTQELMIRVRQSQITEPRRSGQPIAGAGAPSSQHVSDVAKAVLAGRRRREIRVYLERLGLSEEEASRTIEAARPLIRRGSRAAGWSMFIVGLGLLVVAVAAAAFYYFFLLDRLGRNSHLIQLFATIVGTALVYTLAGLLKGVTGWNLR
jgi:hypothetical protein